MVRRRRAEGPLPEEQHVHVGARIDVSACPMGRPHLRSAHQLLRPHLLGGQEDQGDRRRQDVVGNSPLPPPRHAIHASHGILRAEIGRPQPKVQSMAHSPVPRLSRFARARGGLGRRQRQLAALGPRAAGPRRLRSDVRVPPAGPVRPARNMRVDPSRPYRTRNTIRSGKTRRIDTVLCCNVLEHLGPDEQVLRSFHETLVPGRPLRDYRPRRHVAVYGPGCGIGPQAAIRAPTNCAKMETAGFEVVHCRQSRRLAALAWWFSGRVLRRRHLTPGQMIWFDRLFPLIRLIDGCLPVPGMSLIMVGRKPEKP